MAKDMIKENKIDLDKIAEECNTIPGCTPMDNVNHPGHYQSKNGVECIDAIEAAVEELTGLEAVCTANVIKYIWRWKKKNGVEDLKKAKWYLEKLIGVLEG